MNYLAVFIAVLGLVNGILGMLSYRNCSTKLEDLNARYNQAMIAISILLIVAAGGLIYGGRGRKVVSA